MCREFWQYSRKCLSVYAMSGAPPGWPEKLGAKLWQLDSLSISSSTRGPLTWPPSASSQHDDLRYLKTPRANSSCQETRTESCQTLQDWTQTLAKHHFWHILLAKADRYTGRWFHSMRECQRTCGHFYSARVTLGQLHDFSTAPFLNC